MKTEPTVLIVDDDSDLRLALATRVRQAGSRVALAANGRQAPESFDEVHPDVVLLDANIPDGSGPEVCQQIKERTPRATVPVIFISGASAPARAYVQRCAVTSGGDYFLTKPVDRDELLAALERLCTVTSPQP